MLAKHLANEGQISGVPVQSKMEKPTFFFFFHSTVDDHETANVSGGQSTASFPDADTKAAESGREHEANQSPTDPGSERCSVPGALKPA